MRISDWSSDVCSSVLAASAVMPRLPNTISLTRRGHLPPNPASKRRAEPPKALPPYLQRITRLISPSPLIRKNYGISEPDPCLDMLTTSQVGECSLTPFLLAKPPRAAAAHAIAFLIKVKWVTPLGVETASTA